MPKRKRDDYDYISNEIKRLKKMLRRPRRRRRSNSDSSFEASPCSSGSLLSLSYPQDGEIIEPKTGQHHEEAGPSTSAALQSESWHLPEDLTIGPPANPMGTLTDTIVDPQLPVPEESEMDSQTLEIIGENPNMTSQYSKDINKDVAIRLEHVVVNGLQKEMQKQLLAKYVTPANCALIDPPILNAEIKAAVGEVVVKRDKAIEFKQKQLTATISCLGEAVTHLLASKNKDPVLLRFLMDASRMVCDSQHNDSKTRRNFLLSSLKPEMKAQLQSTKIDRHLFGENLQDTIRNAKVINKSSTDLRSIPQIRPQSRRSIPQARPLNWKGPLPGRRPPGAPRTREPAAGPSFTARPPPPPLPQPPRQQQYYRGSKRRPANYHR